MVCTGSSHQTSRRRGGSCFPHRPVQSEKRDAPPTATVRYARGRRSHFADRRRFSKHAQTQRHSEIIVICRLFCLPSPFPILSGRYISTGCLVNKFTFVIFELHRTFCVINWKIMENRARNTFVLLTIAFAFALQCILAADQSTTPASVSPASVDPAHVNPAHVDLSADHPENIAKPAPHVATTNNDSSVSKRLGFLWNSNKCTTQNRSYHKNYRFY